MTFSDKTLTANNQMPHFCQTPNGKKFPRIEVLDLFSIQYSDIQSSTQLTSTH